MANFCENCGAPLNGGAFCQECGSKAKDTAAAISTAASSAVQTVPEPKSGEYSYLTEEAIGSETMEFNGQLEQLDTSNQNIVDTEENKAAINGGHILAMASYVGILCIIPYLLRDRQEYTMYHAKQGLALFIGGIILSIVTGIVGLTWLARIARVIFSVIGVWNAYQGKMEPLPLFGKYVK